MRRMLALLLIAGVSACSGDAAGPADGPTSPPTAAVATSPEISSATGVAGLDDPDQFCALWAGYAGTVQVLAVAASFGELSEAELTVLEVTAAPDLVTRIAALRALWPDEIAAEREVVLAGTMGGWYDRSGRVADILQRQLGAADLAALGEAWVDTLEMRDPELAVPELQLDDARRVLATDQAIVVLGELGPFTDDPALRQAPAVAPSTSAYLADSCPALADSGVGDAI